MITSRLDYPEILTRETQLGPYPLEKLKRVDQITTRVVGPIQRIDERETGFNRAIRGDFGPLAKREGDRFVLKHPIGAALRTMCAYLSPVVDGLVAVQKAPIPQDPEILSRHIKRLCYFLRADIVGICQLPQYAVYTHARDGKPINLNHQYAIVIIVDQDYGTMLGSTGRDWISGSQSYMSYSTTAFIACMVADYIRKLGYPARAHHARDYQVILPPLVILSGLGEMCRLGDAVLNPFLGTRFKGAVVTTDLPLVADKPIDFGLQDFCGKCKKCALECPSKAISIGDKVVYNGYEVWKLDVERCTKFRVTNQKGSSCGRCIKVCPWNKPRGWLHDTIRWMIQHAPVFNNFVITMDGVLGYGKQDKRLKWWFDLVEKDGTLEIPI